LEVKPEISKLHDHKIGEVVSRDEQAIVQTGEDGLVIKRLQLEGGKAMDIREFLRGHENFIESILAS